MRRALAGITGRAAGTIATKAASPRVRNAFASKTQLITLRDHPLVKLIVKSNDNFTKIMEEGTRTLSLASPLFVAVESKANSSIRIKNLNEIINDLSSGNFNEKVMIFESKAIPLQTTSKRSPQMIKFGVELKGGRAGDQSAEKVIFQPITSSDRGV